MLKVRKIIFNDKIIIYWLYNDYIKNAHYYFYLNDKLVGENLSSNFSFTKLKSNTLYKIEIKNKNKTIYIENIKTRKQKNIIDASKLLKKKGLLTKSLQNLIDKAKKDDIIYFSKRVYLTGALYLKNYIELYLDKGAVLLGSDNPKDYLPKIKSRFEGHEMMCYASLINIGKMNHKKKQDIHDIIIRGDGEIRGGSKALRDAIIKEELKHLNKNKVDTNKISYETAAGRYRNRLINISNARNVIIDGLTLGQGASWNVHMIYSDNIITSNCRFFSFVKGLNNGDGWDPDSSSNCVIFHSTFDTGDDCVAIKSGKNPEGNLINIPSKNISIFDCNVIRGHGLAIGSELSGGISNIDIFDCNLKNTLYGIHIKSTLKRGGYCRNVNVENIVTSCINIHSVPYNDDGEASKDITEFSNFKFSDIKITGIMYLDKKHTDYTTPINIDGFKTAKTKFHNFTFDNVKIIRKLNKKDAIKINNASNIKFIK